jgi:hypothetical protein
MPLSRYDGLFGGKKGSAAEAHAAMVKQYGSEKGDAVFYGMVKKRKRRRSVLSRSLRGR